MLKKSDHIAAVLSAMPRFWGGRMGYNEDEIVVDPSEEIISWLRRVDFDFLEVLDLDGLPRGLHDTFGVEATLADIELLFEVDEASRHKWNERETYAPSITNGQFAEWIVERMPIFHFHPVNIAGVNCGPAGAFFGLRDLLQNVDSKGVAIAPSSKIRSRLKGRNLSTYWMRLRIQAGGAVPSLRWPHQSYASAITLAGILFVVIGLFCLMASWNFLILIALGIGLVFHGTSLAEVCLLPQGIETFGDLARMISASMAAGKSDP